MSRSILALLLVTLTCAATAQDREPVMSITVVDATSYPVDETKTQSLDAVVAGLRTVLKLDAVGIQGPGIPKKRIDALVAAIRKSGLKVRIAIVGNEIFTQ